MSHNVSTLFERAVFLNGKWLSSDELAVLELGGRRCVADGDYFYDRLSGLWGRVGEPALARITPGLPLPGVPASDASHGDSGVFVNGRELPAGEHAMLAAAAGGIIAGRYYLDCHGDFGFEGGRLLFNIFDLPPRVETSTIDESLYDDDEEWEIDTLVRF